jgi:TatA/E family protein of Tat protein translocase
MASASQPLKLIIVLLIFVLIFGTKRIKALVGGLGGAAKSFREASGDVPAPRQAKLDNASRMPSSPSRNGAAAPGAERLHVRIWLR